ncbi:MAG: chondroitinase family polysaccharide lyase, partial [Halanaerobiales bacterium]
MPVQCISFEREEVPDSWKVENGGKLSLSAKHTKHGEKSLKWKWEKDSILRAENPKNLKEAGESERGGIKGWVYNEKPINDKITFAFGSKEEIERNNPRYKFDFYLNYKGWRAFWINFEEDAKNPNYDKKEDLSLEVMIISTPAERKTGDLYFDVFEFVKSMNYGRSGDYQTPFSRGKGKAHKTLHYSKKEPYYPLPEKITAEEKKNFDIIDERVRNWLLGEDLNVSNEITDRAFNRLQELIEIGQEEFEHLNLEVDDKGNIKGPGLFAHKTNREPTFGRYIFPKVLLPLTYDYKLNGNEESKDKVLKIFDYIYDQGWAEGSANGTLFLTHNRAAGFYYSLYLMKDELEETGRLERVLNAAHWYLSFGKAFEKQGEDYFETNADEMRTRMVYCLLYLLTLEDTPRKVQYIKSWLDWFNSALKIAHGYADTIKPDYVGFHHRGIISCAYAPDALEMGAALAYFLHGTEFSADVKVIDNLKNGLKTQFIMANKYDTPLATGARFLRGAINNKIAAGYVYLARVLENMEPADKKAAEEMAGIFMKYWDPESEYFQDGLYPSLANYVQFRCNPGRYQSMLKMAEKNYEPIDNPEGFWMKPYGAL